jgi:hypothetical protein
MSSTARPRELDELIEKLNQPDADLMALGTEASRISNAMRRWRSDPPPKRGNRRAVAHQLRSAEFFPTTSTCAAAASANSNG